MVDGTGIAAIHATLKGLRGRIRRYLLADAAARLVVALGVLFWLALAIDWLFEPPRFARILLLMGALAALLVLVVRLVVQKALIRIRPVSVALLLERRFPQFGDSLVTAIEPATVEADQPLVYHADLLAQTRQRAADQLRALDLAAVFNLRPLLQSVLLAAGLALSVICFALIWPTTFNIWARRVLTLEGSLYPRMTRLTVPGFESGRVKVARGSDFQVVVAADTRKKIPRNVQILYRAAGMRDRVSMDRQGNADPAREPFQKYTYTFHVLAPIHFDVVGGDDRVGDLRIDVVEVPTVDVAQTYLRCRFPEYLHREPRDVPITGTVSLPRGTEITLRAMANKELARVDLSHPGSGDAPPTQILPLPQNRRGFEWSLGPLDRDQTLHFTLHDTDQVQSREPWRLLLAAIPDEPPQLTIRLRGIGGAVTPQARVPLSGPITDDYGLARVWIEYAADDDAGGQRDLAPAVHEQSRTVIDEALDLDGLGFKPGQILKLQVKARDNCGLDQGPNEAASERFALQVVTPDQLRAMLESRELNLRRRFEQLLSEVVATRESLTSLPPIAPDVSRPVPQASEETPDTSSDPVSEGALIVERALQNSRKNADETLGVAVAFDDMHLELVNNRIDTEELKSRLQRQIAEPLRRIATERFPELDRRLAALQEAVSQNADGVAALLAAGNAQLDVILIEMQQVLDKMMEMETFNEVVDMLRSIIESQERLNDQTRQARRKSVRDLLED